MPIRYRPWMVKAVGTIAVCALEWAAKQEEVIDEMIARGDTSEPWDMFE